MSDLLTASTPTVPAAAPAQAVSRPVIRVNAALHLLLVVGVAAAWGLGDLGGAFTGGLLLSAYVLGLRHAFDPDHIAAIDNTTRALQSRERAPQSVGMYFALGHSTAVFVAAGLVAVSAHWASLTGDSPALRRVDRPWHMYPVGFLFGLGFDTAAEVSLLILAAAGATAGVPWWVVLLLPLAFTSGMCLLDSADGMFLAGAYRWALERPGRKLRYNIAMTPVSVVFAAVISVRRGLHPRRGSRCSRPRASPRPSAPSWPCATTSHPGGRRRACRPGGRTRAA